RRVAPGLGQVGEAETLGEVRVVASLGASAGTGEAGELGAGVGATLLGGQDADALGLAAVEVTDLGFDLIEAGGVGTCRAAVRSVGEDRASLGLESGDALGDGEHVGGVHGVVRLPGSGERGKKGGGCSPLWSTSADLSIGD